MVEKAGSDNDQELKAKPVMIAMTDHEHRCLTAFWASADGQRAEITQTVMDGLLSVLKRYEAESNRMHERYGDDYKVYI